MLLADDGSWSGNDLLDEVMMLLSGELSRRQIACLSQIRDRIVCLNNGVQHFRCWSTI